jgi:hypothetical protein
MKESQHNRLHPLAPQIYTHLATLKNLTFNDVNTFYATFYFRQTYDFLKNYQLTDLDLDGFAFITTESAFAELRNILIKEYEKEIYK